MRAKPLHRILSSGCFIHLKFSFLEDNETSSFGQTNGPFLDLVCPPCPDGAERRNCVLKELALKGIGIGWLPLSMAHREIENGDLISLANQLGRENLEVAVYADIRDDITGALLDVWSAEQP